MTTPAWEHFEHMADIGVRGRGPNPASAFEQAALALTAVMTDPETVRASREVPIACEARDLDRLLVAWLNALIFEMDTRRMLFSRFQVRINGGRLQAGVWGEPVDPVRHQPAVEVKGATYTALRVEEEGPAAWVAQCVVDV